MNCPYCGHEETVTVNTLSGKQLLQCRGCRQRFGKDAQASGACLEKSPDEDAPRRHGDTEEISRAAEHLEHQAAGEVAAKRNRTRRKRPTAA